MSFAPLHSPKRKPLAGMAIQRLPEANFTGKSVAGFIVSDDVEASEGQMRKSDFLAQLRLAVCAAAADALAGTMWTAEACPAIEQWFDYYETQPADHIEEAIRRYAPVAENAASAGDYLPIVTGRVRESIRAWAADGTMPGNLPPVTWGGAGDEGVSKAQMLAEPGGGDAAVNARRVATQLGAGSPLDGGPRHAMESAFHTDFSGVRVHADSQGAKLSDRLDARAFTVGNHVAFGAGEYGPGTLVGDVLLAHELAHVVQQRGGGPARSDTQSLEEHADRAAEQAVAIGSGASISMAHVRGGLRIQRCDKSKDKTPAPVPGPKDAGTPDAAAPDIKMIRHKIAGLLVDPDGNAEEILKLVGEMGDKAPSVLAMIPPFDGSQNVDLSQLMGSKKSRDMLRRLTAELAKGDDNAKKTAASINAAIDAHEAQPAGKPSKAENDAITRINAALNATGADADPHAAEYAALNPPLKFPVRLYRNGAEDTGGVYYDPALPGTKEGTAGLTRSVKLSIGYASGRPLIFIRLGPGALQWVDNKKSRSTAAIQETLYHEFQHYKRFVEMRNPMKESPEARTIEGELDAGVPGQAETPSGEEEAYSISLAAYFPRLSDDEVKSDLLQILERSGIVDEDLFRKPAFQRIRNAVAGNAAYQQRLIRLIKTFSEGNQRDLAPFRADIEADLAKSPKKP